jgi:uncharacterized protein (TIGR03435 family)
MVRKIIFLLCLSLPSFAAVKVGEPAPEITLDQLLPDRPAVDATLSALKGKAVVLEFWATWCGPCVAAIPHRNQLAVQFKDKPLVFLSITDEARSVIEPFLKKRPIEGWVGVSKGRKVFEDYGVTGVGRVFLIDAAGKLAADVASYTLSAAILDDLLANRPINVPRTVPFSSAIREVDDTLAPPVFDVMIRPTTALDNRGGVGRGRSDVMFRAMTVRQIVRWAYSARPTRTSDIELDDATRYDVSIALPGATRDAFQQVTRDIVSAAFRVNARKETRDMDVYLLTAPSGRPPGLVEATPTGGILSGGGRGRLKLSGPLMALAGLIENALGKPVIDETGLREAFEIDLKYEAGVPGALEEAVRALGLKLEPARRQIEFLTLTKAQ